jgi:hypothetical protein
VNPLKLIVYFTLALRSMKRVRVPDHLSVGVLDIRGCRGQPI